VSDNISDSQKLFSSKLSELMLKARFIERKLVLEVKLRSSEKTTFHGSVKRKRYEF